MQSITTRLECSFLLREPSAPTNLRKVVRVQPEMVDLCEFGGLSGRFALNLLCKTDRFILHLLFLCYPLSNQINL